MDVWVNMTIGKKMCILLKEGEAFFLRGIWKKIRYLVKGNSIQVEQWQGKWNAE